MITDQLLARFPARTTENEGPAKPFGFMWNQSSRVMGNTVDKLETLALILLRDAGKLNSFIDLTLKALLLLKTDPPPPGIQEFDTVIYSEVPDLL